MLLRSLPLVMLLLLALPLPAVANKALFDEASAGQEAVAGLKRHQVTIDGLKVFYLDNERKDAARTILMVHGFGDSSLSWTQFARRFRDQEFRIVIPDLPGFGQSDRAPKADYGFAAQSRRLLELMQKLGIPRFHVVGNSMGGGIAAELAVQQPSMVQSLTLMDAAGVHYRPTELDDAMLAGRNMLVVKTPADFEALLAFVMMQRPPMPRPVLDYLAERAIKDNALHERIFREALFPDMNFLLPKLDAIKAPTLILWGEKDRVLHPDNALIFDKYIPDSRVVIMPKVGHTPMAEAPYESSDEVVKFINALGGAAP
ncbi:MAG: alpha/beta hydrolase [Moraxellaceae bacterium]|nr:alpha/beta hydrolase [Moraxellaceae bacterium]